jgi:hypothetical protein
MPTLVHTLPTKPTWNGANDQLRGASDGMLIGTSHVSILGLRILGLPVVESPEVGQIKRLYGINRFDRSLEDLEIGHCVFAGDIVTNPFHVGIIANGYSVNVHHCIFRGMKISVVYWSGNSKGHSRRYFLWDQKVECAEGSLLNDWVGRPPEGRLRTRSTTNSSNQRGSSGVGSAVDRTIRTAYELPKFICLQGRVLHARCRRDQLLALDVIRRDVAFNGSRGRGFDPVNLIRRGVALHHGDGALSID